MRATFVFTVEVSGEGLTIEQAEQIASERIGYDEDLRESLGIEDYAINRSAVRQYERAMEAVNEFNATYLATSANQAGDIGRAPSIFPVHVIRAMANDYSLLLARLHDRIVPRTTFIAKAGE